MDYGIRKMVGRTSHTVAVAFCHHQQCCESVTIGDICGSLEDHEPESYTWTFYRSAPIEGEVVVRWYGESNGWYGETVDIRALAGTSKAPTT